MWEKNKLNILDYFRCRQSPNHAFVSETRRHIISLYLGIVTILLACYINVLVKRPSLACDSL